MASFPLVGRVQDELRDEQHPEQREAAEDGQNDPKRVAHLGASSQGQRSGQRAVRATTVSKAATEDGMLRRWSEESRGRG